jgi:hypothetical protein
MSRLALEATPSLGERVTRLLSLARISRADTAEELEAIYELRYRAYLREGAIKPNAARRFSDDDDAMENAWIFGVYIGDVLASSIRIHVSTPEHPDTPGAHVFPDILGPLIEAGKIYVDPTRFVADFASARQYPELHYVTTRLVVVASEHFNADYVLATVRAEHQAFYKRVFGGRVVCPPRPYPALDKPISMMMSPRSAVIDHVNRRYPFFRSTPAERAALFDRPAQAARRTAA